MTERSSAKCRASNVQNQCSSLVSSRLHSVPRSRPCPKYPRASSLPMCWVQGVAKSGCWGRGVQIYNELACGAGMSAHTREVLLVQDKAKGG